MHADTLKFYKYNPVKKPMYQGKFCQTPFDTLQINHDGDVQLCDCQMHMPYTIGNIFKNSLEEIWSNSEAELVRQSVFDGDFTYCSWSCVRLNQPLADRPDTIPVVRNFPKIIKLDLDLSCNLKCPSCREAVIIEKNSDKIQKQVQLFEEIKQWALSNPTQSITVIPLGSGEIFASHSGQKFLESLRDYPHRNLKLHITTNGTLITKNKDLLDNIKHLIKICVVSIDAATPETYAKVRGGNWTELMAGLEYMHSIHKPMNLRYVVQQNNWHEILEFAELAKKFDASVFYSDLLNWGHWTVQWWHDNNVLDRNKAIYSQVIDQLQQVKNKYPSKSYFSADIENTLKK
jgi:radical SAM protein with 4Fe4S-binding SPASM domain